jgi:hypothetical protein
LIVTDDTSAKGTSAEHAVLVGIAKENHDLGSPISSTFLFRPMPRTAALSSSLSLSLSLSSFLPLARGSHTHASAARRGMT